MNFGIATEEQLAKINKLSKGKTFKAEDIFVFGGKAAGDMIIENRYIQLHQGLLESFVNNAKEGVSWLLNHSWSTFSEPTTIFGRTFDGRLEPSTENGETVAMFLDKYIPRSDTLKNGRSANSIIEDIENGVLFDTSIGWGASKFECSICGNDVRDWRKCEHIPGRKYVIDEDSGASKLCWAIAKAPGYLMEESGVFDGAYKGAGISMSSIGDEFENQNGKFIVVNELKELSNDAHVFGSLSSKGDILTFVKKSEHKKVFAVQKEGDTKKMDKIKAMLSAFGIEHKEDFDVKEVLSQLGEKWDATVQSIKEEALKSIPLVQLDSTEEFMKKESVVEKLGKEHSAEEVLKLAKEGQDYHALVVDEAIAMGVRAQGNDFPAETWKNTFANMATSAIKDISKTFAKQAEQEIPAGRVSQFGKQLAAGDIPDEAFKVK